jgi:hypothetical protein
MKVVKICLETIAGLHEMDGIHGVHIMAIDLFYPIGL